MDMMVILTAEEKANPGRIFRMETYLRRFAAVSLISAAVCRMREKSKFLLVDAALFREADCPGAVVLAGSGSSLPHLSGEVHFLLDGPLGEEGASGISVSFGTGGKNTLTRSSAGEGKALLDLQRAVLRPDGGRAEPGEFVVPFPAGMAANDLLAACGVLVLAGFFPSPRAKKSEESLCRGQNSPEKRLPTQPFFCYNNMSRFLMKGEGDLGRARR